MKLGRTLVPSIGFLFLLIVIIPILGASVLAQSDKIAWNKPFTLSNTPQNSEHPVTIADSFGYVHVFWGEDIDGNPFKSSQDPSPGNSIVYTRWDGTSWSPLMDVLSVPGELIAKFVAVDIDSENRLHAVWTGQSNIYYSNALSWEAESAHAWSQPIVIATHNSRSGWESDVVADHVGNLHIVYAEGGDDPGVYHVRSQDGGLTWESAIKLSKPLDRLEKNFSHVKVIIDGADRLQAVWQANQEEGFGQAIYHARSLDHGESWSPATQLGYRSPDDTWVEWPYITALGESELHLIYTNGSNIGRAHRISRDGGETWSEPYDVIIEMEGINGYVFPLVDGAGRMHLIINMRTRDQIGGIFYARWLGDRWSAVEPLVIKDPNEASAHYTVGTVRLGNELHVAWTQLNRGEIGYIYGLIPSLPQTPPLPVPTVEQPTPTPTSEPQPTSSLIVPTPTSFPQPVKLPEISRPATAPVYLPVNPMLFATVVSLLLVVSVALWWRLRPR